MPALTIPPYLDWPAQFCLLVITVTWVASLVTSNVSQVDRLWTALPTIYSAYYAFLPLWPNSQPLLFVPYTPKSLGWSTVKDYSPRALLMFSLVVIWMGRLSYNAWRRGMFDLKGEDYRWAVLRKQLPPWLFQVTNLTFIAATQNILLLLLGLPIYVASVLQPHTPLSYSDYTLAAAALTILAFEFTADNQQFAFHAYKNAFLAKEKGDNTVKAYDANEQWLGARLSWTTDDAKRGFITRGLWRYSRHPNFACEQLFWWLITLMPMVAPPPPSLPLRSELPQLQVIFSALTNSELRKPLLDSVQSTLIATCSRLLPAISHSALFFSSTAYTEAITASKYTDAYRAYQKRVGMFGPAATLCKALKLKFISGEREWKEVQRLVWGKSHEKDD